MQGSRRQADYRSNKIVNFKQRVRDENSILRRPTLMECSDSVWYGLERLSYVHSV